MSDTRVEVLVETFLAHYGVKGMKWGVRKDRNIVAVAVKSHPTARKIKTTGGQNHPATEEAIRTAMIRRQAKKSHVHSLTNKELNEAIQRMNLEQQFKNLTAADRSHGRKVVGKLLGEMGQEDVAVASTYVTNQVGLRKPSRAKAAGRATSATLNIAKSQFGDKKKK